MLTHTLAETTTTLPEGGIVPLAIAVVAGLALWLAGVKIVRGVFLAIGAAAGAFTGAVIIPLTGMPTLGLGPISLSPGFAGLIVGGIIGALVALGMLRVVITFTAAGAFAVAGAMTSLVFLHFSPSGGQTDGEGLALHEEPPAMIDFSDEARRLAAEELTDRANGLADSVPEGTAAAELLDDLNTEENRQRIKDAAERSKAFVENAYNAVMNDYEQRPARDKLIIASATLAGLGLGLLMGVIMPRRSSALVTSLFGSAIWLGAGRALILANTDPSPDLLHQPPLIWAIAWGGIAIVGMLVQSGLLLKRGGGSDDADQDDDD